MEPAVIVVIVILAINMLILGGVTLFTAKRFIKKRNSFGFLMVAQPFISLVYAIAVVFTMTYPTQYKPIIDAIPAFGQIAHLYLIQYQAFLLKTILIKWNDRANIIVGVVGGILLLFVVIMSVVSAINPLISYSALSNGLYYAYVMIVDIVFFVLVVLSLRSYGKKWKEMKFSFSSVSIKCQITLALSLVFIILGGTLNALVKDQNVRYSVSVSLTSIQILASYYYFYNVMVILRSSRQTATQTATQTHTQTDISKSANVKDTSQISNTSTV